MKIMLNGKPHLLEHALTIQQLLATLNLANAHVAIEHNAEIIPASTYAQTLLAADDQVEIIHFVGGG